MVAFEAGQREAEREVLDVDGVVRRGVRIAERTHEEAVAPCFLASNLQDGVGTDRAARGLRDNRAFGRERQRVSAGGALEKPNHGFPFLLRHEVEIAAALNAGNQVLGDQRGHGSDGQCQLRDSLIQELNEGVAEHVLLRVHVLVNQRHLADAAVNHLLEVHLPLADRRAFALHVGAEIRLVQRVLQVHVRLHQRQADIRRREPIRRRFLRVFAVLDRGDVLRDRRVGPDPLFVHQRDEFRLGKQLRSLSTTSQPNKYDGGAFLHAQTRHLHFLAYHERRQRVLVQPLVFEHVQIVSLPNNRPFRGKQLRADPHLQLCFAVPRQFYLSPIKRCRDCSSPENASLYTHRSQTPAMHQIRYRYSRHSLAPGVSLDESEDARGRRLFPREAARIPRLEASARRFPNHSRRSALESNSGSRFPQRKPRFPFEDSCQSAMDSVRT